MLDKELFRLIGPNRKYVFYTVLSMVVGMLANTGITASLCYAVHRLIEDGEPLLYLYPALFFLLSLFLRYLYSRTTGSLKDMLGRKVKKDLRKLTYDKILSLGLRSTEGMNMAGLT